MTQKSPRQKQPSDKPEPSKGDIIAVLAAVLAFLVVICIIAFANIK